MPRPPKAKTAIEHCAANFALRGMLGYDHSLISSNKTLARTIEEYTSAKFTGDRASKRPDLFLAQNLRGGFTPSAKVLVQIPSAR